WGSTEQTQLCVQQPKKRKSEEAHVPSVRRPSPPRPTPSQTDDHLPTSVKVVREITALESDGVTNVDMVTSPHPKGKKRKISVDDDFIPPPANATPEIQRDGVLASKETRALKRKAPANKYRRSMQEDKPA